MLLCVALEFFLQLSKLGLIVRLGYVLSRIGPNFLIQAYRLWGVIPTLPATSATLWLASTTCLAASILNSFGYRFWLIFTILIAILYG